MKKSILLLLLVAIAAIGTHAATKYEINVAGVEVTSDNCSNVTGGDIKFYTPSGGTQTTPYSGYSYVQYNSSTNTLTLANVKIERNSSGDYALHNRDCEYLKVNFVGTCDLTSYQARAIRFNKSGYLVASSGATVNVTGRDDGAIYITCDNTHLYMQGPGTFNIKSTSKKGAIQSDLESVDIASLRFSNNVKAVIESPESPLYKIEYVVFNGSCNVTLKATGNSSCPVVRDVKNFDCSATSDAKKAAILAPYGAYYSSSAQSIVNSSGSKIYNQDIHISNDYVAIFNSDYFPDANFRSALLEVIPKGYITSSDANSITSLVVNYKNISDLTGVSYFSMLRKLYCNNNQLTSLPSLPSGLQELYCSNNRISGAQYITSKKSLTYLDISNNSTLSSLLLTSDEALSSLNISGCSSLQSLYCDNCNFTSLPTLPSSLTELRCSNNKLTSFPTLPANMEYVRALNNKFTSVSISDHSKLKSLDLSDNTSLTGITLARNSAFNGLYITGCTALKSLTMQSLSSYNFSNLSLPSTIEYFDCGFNNLTSLPFTLPSGLKTLCCYHNKLTSLPTLPSGIVTLECNDNKFATLNVTDKTSLKSLRAEDNPNLTSLNCSYNALTSLNVSNCSALVTLNCSNNQLTSLPTSLPTSVKSLYIGGNKLTTLSITGRSNLQTLDVNSNKLLTSLNCSGNALTLLNTSGCSALASINCSNNKFTTLSVTYLSNLKTLNVSNNSSLATLNCYNNALTSLDIAGCGSLVDLECNRNELTSLHVQGFKSIQRVNAFSNNLAVVNVSGSTSLNYLNVRANQLDESAMASLISTMRSIPETESEGTFYVYGENYSGDKPEGNVITDELIKTVRGKRWIPSHKVGDNWVEITVSDGVRGDLNDDGVVDVTDVSILIDMVLGKQEKDFNLGNLNGDSELDVSDVSILIDIVLGKG